MRVVARHAEGELMQVGLANDHAALAPDATHRRRIMLGRLVWKDDAPGGGDHAGDIDQVFDRDHRPDAILARDLDEGMQVGLLLDALARLAQLHMPILRCPKCLGSYPPTLMSATVGSLTP